VRLCGVEHSPRVVVVLTVGCVLFPSGDLMICCVLEGQVRVVCHGTPSACCPVDGEGKPVVTSPKPMLRNHAVYSLGLLCPGQWFGEKPLLTGDCWFSCDGTPLIRVASIDVSSQACQTTSGLLRIPLSRCWWYLHERSSPSVENAHLCCWSTLI
jgi:hypothetical protein